MQSDTSQERLVELLERRQGSIRRLASLYLRESDDIEDAVQETCIQAWRAIDSLRSPKAFSGWLSTIARNVCLAMLRRRNSYRSAVSRLSDDVDLGPHVWGHDVLGSLLVEGLLDLLTETQRVAMVLHYLEGYSVGDVAKLRGVSVGTIKTTLSRARNTLRREMGIMEARPAGPVKINRRLSGYADAFDLSSPDRAYATHMNRRTDQPFWKDVEILEVLSDEKLLACVVGRLMGPGIRKPYDVRSFMCRGGEWENLGNDRLDSLEEARQVFARGQQRVVILQRILAGAAPTPEDVCLRIPETPGGRSIVGRVRGCSGRLRDMLVARQDDAWDQLVPVTSDGSFSFPSVSPGVHRATLFLAMNLRGRGVGSTEFEVGKGRSVRNVAIQMEPLAEVVAVVTDENGEPLEGLCLSATWQEDGTGLWVEGSRSDRVGSCYIFLPLNERLYLRATDGAGRRSMLGPLELTATHAERIDLGPIVVPVREEPA